MDIHDYAPSLRELMHHVLAWDHVSGDPAERGLSRAARAALIAELGGVAGSFDGAARASRWEAVRDFLRPNNATPDAQRERCEGRVLRGYEKLCERELPIHVSSMLLRHYSTIRRAGAGR
jgi:hypothetical protein